ncbi:MAG TPA: hypothetical protein PKD61_14035 [Polyangiaceae bacterium]|nr:hypothetical protein [Polyangiaceae bacterium]
MKREVFFLIGKGGAVLFSDASQSPSQLPDSRKRWQMIWEHRDELEELSHSHPNGPLAFSREDETTMQALETALGKTLRFSVLAPTGMITKRGDVVATVEDEPWWSSLLRLASGMPFADDEPTATSKQSK